MQCCALKQRAVTVLSLYLQSASPCPRKTGMEARDLGRVRLHDPDISDTEVLEKSAGITRDAVTELVIKPALKKAIQVSNPDVPGTNS